MDSYSVTNTLTNVTNSSAVSSVTELQSYEAELMPSSGYNAYDVRITMGGVDVSTYYSNGKIAIPKVTGNIVITATAIVSEITIDPNIVVGGFNHADKIIFRQYNDNGDGIGYHTFGFPFLVSNEKRTMLYRITSCAFHQNLIRRKTTPKYSLS